MEMGLKYIGIGQLLNGHGLMGKFAMELIRYRESLLAESDSEWDGLPAHTIMGHIHFHVSIYRKQKSFIQKVWVLQS